LNYFFVKNKNFSKISEQNRKLTFDGAAEWYYNIHISAEQQRRGEVRGYGF